MPEYTLSLLIWIVPIIIMAFILHRKKSLGSIQIKAATINLIVLAGVGFALDLLFANLFFTFPNPKMVLGVEISNIPIEEFLFYLFGFWFIILLYIFNDELFLLKYNKDDKHYAKFSRRIKGLLYLQYTKISIITLIVCAISFTILKQLLNPGKSLWPGYILFLLICAYIPYLFFWKLTKLYVNRRAFAFTIIITTLISIIWEVTLALPRGYWNYNHNYMIGIFISPWSNIPFEAITVWLFSSLIVLSYEYTKIFLHRKSQS